MLVFFLYETRGWVNSVPIEWSVIIRRKIGMARETRIYRVFHANEIVDDDEGLGYKPPSEHPARWWPLRTVFIWTYARPVSVLGRPQTNHSSFWAAETTADCDRSGWPSCLSLPGSKWDGLWPSASWVVCGGTLMVPQGDASFPTAAAMLSHGSTLTLACTLTIRWTRSSGALPKTLKYLK